MSSFVGKLLFSIALVFLILGFIFVVAGYATFWLVPREEFSSGSARILGVGLKIACFQDFKFLQHLDTEGQLLDGCVDNTRDSARFNAIDKDVWSPRWFQTVQDMHFACILMMVFNLLLVGGFITIYFLAAYQKRKGKRLSPCLLMSRCGLALWFVLTIIIGIILLAEPLLFYTNYLSDTANFYYTDQHTYDFGPGFGLTIGAGLALIGSGGIGIALFCGIIRKLIKSSMNPEHYDDYYNSQEGSQYSASEVDGLSNSEDPQGQVRKDPDGVDESEVIENYNAEPGYRSNRQSTASIPQDSTDEKSPADRPVPAPRRSLSSKDTSREPSVTPSTATQSSKAPQYAEMEMQRPPSNSYAASHVSSVRSARPQQFQYDFKPGHGYVPKSARPSSDVESQYSSANQRASMSPHAPPAAGGRLYVPPSRASYAGSATGYSDVESHQSDRNRSVTKSSMARQASESPQPTTPQKVVNPKSSKSAKHSRYAAAGW